MLKMEEELKWQQKQRLGTNIVDDLQKAVEQLVLQQVNEINGKIESLAQMGVIPDGPEIQQLRLQMKEFRESNQRINNA
jgi:hypothetical protein